MKKNFVFLAILAMALVFTMAVIGCDNGDDNDNGNGNGGGSTALNGTWQRSRTIGGYYQIKVDGNHWEYYDGASPVAKGTWSSNPAITASSTGTITLVMTHIYERVWQALPSEYNSIKTNTATFSLNASGTTFTLSNSSLNHIDQWSKLEGTYTKEGGNSGTAPTVTTASLPGGTVGTAYSQTLTATGDTPITWSIESGTLPTGLTLSTAGVISGNPTTANTFNFTVKATNAKGNNTKPLSITIASSGGNAVNIEMVQIPGGSFQMGDVKNEGDSDEKPVHTVTLSAFKMGKYEVTQAQYQTVMGSNPSHFHGGTGREPASGEVQANRPVEYVSWYDALVFCNKLSMAEGLTPAYRINNSTDPAQWGTVPTSSNATWDAVTIVSGSTGYRLPTEAQWEYAAKGGNNSPGNYTYPGSNNADEVAWYYNNSGRKTHEVGKKQPNGLGLYDMSGNVYECCWDWYGSYSSGSQTNPSGAASGSGRVIRGGDWFDNASGARSVDRSYNYPSSRYDSSGFRLVRP